MRKIQKANPKDISLIQEIAAQSWRAHYPGIISHEQIDYMLDLMYSEAELQKHFSLPNYQYYFIEDAEDIMGIMGFEFHYEPQTTKLHRIYLLEEATGKGLGKLALNFLKHEAESVGDKRIILNVNKENPSYHFYLSQHFKKYAEGIFDIGNGYVMDDYLMEYLISD